jgi:hypothetical protein
MGMTARMRRADRLAEGLLLIQEITLDRKDGEEPDEAAAQLLLDRAGEEILPKFNAHLKALGLRPVHLDRVYRGAARPKPSFHLLLLGIRMATRLEAVEQAFVESGPEAARQLREARIRLKAPRALPPLSGSVPF